MSDKMELMGLLKVNKLSDKEAKELYKDLKKLMGMCDELDCQDAFGTEGWRHNLGWED
jgi:hypothetical protein